MNLSTDLNKMNSIEKYIIELKFNNSELLSNFLLLNNLGKFSKYTTGVFFNN